jgi:hypothetical protein
LLEFRPRLRDYTGHCLPVLGYAALVLIGLGSAGAKVWLLLIVGGAVTLLVVIRAYGIARTTVTVCQDAVVVRRPTRRRAYAWDAIEDIDVVGTDGGRWARLNGQFIRRWEDAALVWGDGGCEIIPWTRSPAAGEGLLPDGAPTATQLKVNALRRYRDHATRSTRPG